MKTIKLPNAQDCDIYLSPDCTYVAAFDRGESCFSLYKLVDGELELVHLHVSIDTVYAVAFRYSQLFGTTEVAVATESEILRLSLLLEVQQLPSVPTAQASSLAYKAGLLFAASECDFLVYALESASALEPDSVRLASRISFDSPIVRFMVGTLEADLAYVLTDQSQFYLVDCGNQEKIKLTLQSAATGEELDDAQWRIVSMCCHRQLPYLAFVRRDIELIVAVFNIASGDWIEFVSDADTKSIEFINSPDGVCLMILSTRLIVVDLTSLVQPGSEDEEASLEVHELTDGQAIRIYAAGSWGNEVLALIA